MFINKPELLEQPEYAVWSACEYWKTRGLTDAANHADTDIYDEGDKGGALDGLESDADGYIYSTNYEHNAVLRRRTGGEWETVVHDPRPLWPDTMSIGMDTGSFTSRQISCIARRVTTAGRICGANRMRFFACGSRLSPSC